MEKVKKQFSPRQFMVAKDFEIFHYLDSRPVSVEYHSHDFYEIYFFLSGKVAYIIEGKTYHLRPGDILLTNNRELHAPLVADGRIYERFVTWISPAFLKNLREGATDLARCFEESSQKHYNLLRPGGEMLQRIRGLYGRLELVSDAGGYGSEVLRRAYMMELLVAVNTAYFDDADTPEPDIVYSKKISDVICYINENLRGDLSLDFLSRTFYVSKYHLSRQFKLYAGLTLHRYILKKRLIAAKLMLLDGASVNRAYLESGFGDYSNFTKLFRQEFGLSPKQFALRRAARQP